jgi:hypothetical protein
MIKLGNFKKIDRQIRKTINYEIKRQSLPLIYIYSNYKHGGIGLSKCKEEYYTLKIDLVDYLFEKEHGRRIMKGFFASFQKHFSGLPKTLFQC